MSQAPESEADTAPSRNAEITWNHALEHLLCQEAEKCSGHAWMHNKAETHYAKKTNYLQLPIIILSAVSGFISAAVPPEGSGVTVGVGSVSILVSILGTINSYFAFAKRTEGHRIAAVQYSQICRAIRIEMNLPQEQRTPPKVLLKMIKEDLKRLSETAPRIPDSIIEAFRKEIIPKATNISHPEIVEGIEDVKPYKEEEEKPVEPEIVELPGAVAPDAPGAPNAGKIRIGLQV